VTSVSGFASLTTTAALAVGPLGALNLKALRDDEPRGFGRWAAGRWTLERARRLKTAGAYDVVIEDDLLLWVAAFDHFEKSHTRHLRPVELKLR